MTKYKTRDTWHPQLYLVQMVDANMLTHLNKMSTPSTDNFRAGEAISQT